MYNVRYRLKRHNPWSLYNTYASFSACVRPVRKLEQNYPDYKFRVTYV